MAKTCALGKCPTGCGDEVVVTCTGTTLSAATGGVQCRFGSARSTACVYEEESGTLTCCPPKGLSLDELLNSQLYTDDDVFLADLKDLPALQRCDSGDDLDAGEDSTGGGGGNDKLVGAPNIGIVAEHAPVSIKDAPDPETAPGAAVLTAMSFLDRFLAVWVLGAMVIGVLVGNFQPGIKNAFNVAQLDGTSLPIAAGLWLMMWPPLAKVKYELLWGMLSGTGLWKQLALSVALNWVVGPLLMVGLAWATLPDQAPYRNGVILVGLARCIAMVLLWNMLAKGNPEFCAILVAVNSVLQIVLYAPFALFYLQVVSRQYLGDSQFHIGFWRVARSVLTFLGAPLVAAILTRLIGVKLKGREWYDNKFAPRIGPVALLALLYTIFVLFALQGHSVIHDIGNVFRVAVPMLLYFSIMWTGTFLGCRRAGMRYADAVVQAFTASSNNFELAIAIAVGVFGVNSKEALAATVGPLIEVPVLLGLVYVALALQRKFDWK